MHIYDAPKKQEAREEVHALLKAEVGGKLLLLPGPRRHEIDTALLCGWKPGDLILVEKEPAVLANLTRLLSPSERAAIQRHGGMLSSVCKMLASEGVRIAAAHLDFCDPIEPIRSGSVRTEVERFVASGIMERGLLAVTVLEGRVKGYFSRPDRYRMMYHTVRMRSRAPVVEEAAGHYHNPVSRNTMLWGVYRID